MPPGDHLNPFTFLTDDEATSEASGQEIPDLDIDAIMTAQAAASTQASSSRAAARYALSQTGNSSSAAPRVGNKARKSSHQAPRGARLEPVATPAAQTVSSQTRRKAGVGSSKTNAISLISSDEDETPTARRPSYRSKSRSSGKSTSGSPTKPKNPTLPSATLSPSSKYFSVSQPSSKYAMQEMDLKPISIGGSNAEPLPSQPRRKSRTSSTPAASLAQRTTSPPLMENFGMGYGEAGPGPSTMANASNMLDFQTDLEDPPSLQPGTAILPMDVQPITVGIAKRANSPPDSLDAFGREYKKSKDRHSPIPVPLHAPMPQLSVTIASATNSPVKKGPKWATAQSQRTPSPQPPPKVVSVQDPLPQPQALKVREAGDELGNSSAAEMDVDTDHDVPPVSLAEEGIGPTPAKDLLRMLGISSTEDDSSAAVSTRETSPPVLVPEDFKDLPKPDPASEPLTASTVGVAIAEVPQAPLTFAATPLELISLDTFEVPQPVAVQSAKPKEPSPEPRIAPQTQPETDTKPSPFQLKPLDLPELDAASPTASSAAAPLVAPPEDTAMVLENDDWEAAIPSEMKWDSIDVELDSPQLIAAPPTEVKEPLDISTEVAVETAIEEVRADVGEIDIGAAETAADSRSSSIVPMTKAEIEKEMRERMTDPAFQEFLRAKGMTEEEWLGTKPTKSPTVQREGSVVDITDERSAESKAMRRAKAKALKLERSQALQRRIKPKMTREEWRRMIEMADDLEVDQLVSPASPHSPFASDPSTGSAEGLEASTHLSVRRYSSPAASSSTRGVTPFSFDPFEQPPPGRRGKVLREFETEEIDRWNRLLPKISARGAVLRMIFESWISEATASDDPSADPIRVVNDVDAEDLPPDMEFQYSNKMIYHSHVPDPELGTGCGCDGPCDPNSRTCSCVKRQELYFYNTGLKGFAYDEDGHLKQDGTPIWECGPLCGCPAECANRVIQRGRSSNTKIDLFKTKTKGWGIKARCEIPQGTFLGIYSGEMVTELESERRGHLYDEIGRTYLFDLDGWQIRNPPAIEDLRKLDPRLAELAERAYLRSLRVAEENEGDESPYSAYSVDAFHWGNFTRYFNHSCDPNLAISQAYVTDCNPERPLLVIFTRKPVARNEELCISYKGIDEDLDEMRLRYEVEKAKRSGKLPHKGKKRRGKHKSSASAHITNPEKASLVKDACRCGAWNCDGRMWGAGAADESDEDDD